MMMNHFGIVGPNGDSFVKEVFDSMTERGEIIPFPV
jgi:hypothetical protein